MRHVFSLFVTIATILVTVGCGGTDKSANGKLNDQALLASLVTEFADTGSNYTMA